MSGSLAYVLFGGLGAAILLVHTLGVQGEPVEGAWLLAVSLATALLAAAIESLPLGIDDNLTVPLLCAPCLPQVCSRMCASKWMGRSLSWWWRSGR